ncbi:TetR/AcrR family transcriptional regulator [Micromonospora musae]|uniref:TetR/AcrR family transcriptional regulator n=1 Tax=Micromonospora musae TaxID=1894970 RepID=A0A3A9XXP6_9ACTN|nr:TetR/AcrR family transcriptional regulator [Micromonospora musae]RKN15744.1 TetR/AcrR family transcriptional regulator [Micromonospora musae]RKN29183.1 TetR/AcrR family transcriptional regulator [Micromonospora musae]
MTSPGSSPSPTGAEPSHRRLDARRNHEKIIAAARELFGEHGLQVTVPQVAERAGVGRATVYRSYPSKDDLILALAREQLQALERLTLTALDSTDAYQGLRDYVPELFERLAHDRVLATVFFEARLSPASHLLDLVGRLVEAAIPSGRIRADADQLDVRVVLCGTVRQLIALDQWDPALWRRYGEMVLNAFHP